MTPTRRELASLSAMFLLGGCPQDRSAEPYAVSVLVEGDGARPLPSATVLRDGRSVGTTGRDGRVTIRLKGSEGETVPLTIRCPSEYTPPAAPLDVPLRRLPDSARLASYRVACKPELRTVVVAVRATNGANLPVLYLGKEVARTDTSGAAHLELRLRPGERFELTLSTDEKGAEPLMPRNPTSVFVVKETDEIVIFDQPFVLPKSRAIRRGPKAF